MTGLTGMARALAFTLSGLALAAAFAAGGAVAQTAPQASAERRGVARPAPIAKTAPIARPAPVRKLAPVAKPSAVKPAARAAKPRKAEPPASPAWLCRAATNGNIRAAFLLGRLYLTGSGVPLSPELGAAWLRVARDRGNADAARLLDSIGPAMPVRPACGRNAAIVPLPVAPSAAPNAASPGAAPGARPAVPAAEPPAAPKDEPPPDPGLMGAGAHLSSLGPLPAARGRATAIPTTDPAAFMPGRPGSPLFRRLPASLPASGTEGFAGWSAAGMAADAPAAIREIVNRHAVDLQLDPDLVLAMIAVESRFRPDAVSPKNAAGLMQLIPATARRFGVVDVFDPEDNILGGMRYLRWLLDNFQGDVTKAVAAYNAGEGAVEQHGGVPPYPETQNYVRRIRATYSLDRLPYNPAPAATLAPVTALTAYGSGTTGNSATGWTSPAWSGQGWAARSYAAFAGQSRSGWGEPGTGGYGALPARVAAGVAAGNTARTMSGSPTPWLP